MLVLVLNFHLVCRIDRSVKILSWEADANSVTGALALLSDTSARTGPAADRAKSTKQLNLLAFLVLPLCFPL